MSTRASVRRLEQKHRHELQRRAAAEDAALLQMTDVELEHFVSFLRKNSYHVPSIELGMVSRLRTAPSWATPDEFAATVRYERLSFAALEQVHAQEH